MFGTVQHRCAKMSVDVRAARKSMLSFYFCFCLEGLSRADIVVLLAAARDKKDGSPNARRRGLLRPSSRRSIYAVRRLGKKRGKEDLIRGKGAAKVSFEREMNEEETYEVGEWFHGERTR